MTEFAEPISGEMLDKIGSENEMSPVMIPRPGKAPVYILSDKLLAYYQDRSHALDEILSAGSGEISETP